MPEIPVVPAVWRFPAHPASVGRARHAVAEVLPRQLHTELGLITSELVTNAIRHGTRADDLVELVLWPADGHYWLAVSDPGDGKPSMGHRAPADAESGRGLLLVDALAAAWAVVPRPYRGKSVVAGLALGRAGRPRSPCGSCGAISRPTTPHMSRRPKAYGCALLTTDARIARASGVRCAVDVLN